MMLPLTEVLGVSSKQLFGLAAKQELAMEIPGYLPAVRARMLGMPVRGRAQQPDGRVRWPWSITHRVPPLHIPVRSESAGKRPWVGPVEPAPLVEREASRCLFVAELEDSMGRAARRWQLRRCILIDGVPRCPSRTT